MSIKYEIKKGSVEISYKSRKEIMEGIAWKKDEDSKLIKQFDNLEEAKTFFNNEHYTTHIRYYDGYVVPFYEVEEYWIEENEYDADGINKGLVYVEKFSKFPTSPIELKKLGLMEIDAADVDDLDQNLYIHTDKFENWLDEKLNEKLSKDMAENSWYLDHYICELFSQFDTSSGYELNYGEDGVVRINQCFVLPATDTKSGKDEMYGYSVNLYPTFWNKDLDRWYYDTVFDLTSNEEYKKQLTNKSQKQKNDFVR